MLGHRNRVLGWIQGSLFAAAALCAIWVTWTKVQSAVEGREQRAAVERAIARRDCPRACRVEGDVTGGVARTRRTPRARRARGRPRNPASWHF